MSYTKQTGIPCAVGETVVEIDSGQLVAVQCPASRDPYTNMMVFMPAARLIDSAGKTQVDRVGRNVATATTYSAPPDEVTRMTADAVVRECLFLVLGEALTADPATPGVTLLKFSADNIAQCSIRNAIASANVAAPNAGEVL